MTGFYTHEEMHRVFLYATDYVDYKNEDGLIEYFCLFADELDDDYYVANTESFGLDVGLSTAPLANTCCPFPQQFYEGFTTFQVNTSCYANDPKKYKERVLRGGKADSPINSNEPTPPTAYRADDAGDVYRASKYFKTTTLNLDTIPGRDGYMATPACKGLAPMDDMWAVSYNLCREYTDSEGNVQKSLVGAIEESDKVFSFHISKCVMRSITWQKGEGSKLYDQLSSAECRQVDFKVRNHTGPLVEMDDRGRVKQFLTHLIPAASIAGEPYGVVREEQTTVIEP
jgi:hypothetical protein